jgi:hypothetical protein
MRPLVKDLKHYGRERVYQYVWDEDKKETFNLRALLFITINDWPAHGNLSGQTNKGY